ncbi:MAG: cellulose biosynthesis protein BcsS [Pseudolabrys sp.]
MRGTCVCAAIVLAIAAAISSVSVAAAVEPDGDTNQLLLFSGADLWRNGNFSHGGVYWSPDGLERDGLTFKALLSAGTYRYRSGALNDQPVVGRMIGAQILPGWRFIRGPVEVKAFTGIDIRDLRLFPDDPAARLKGYQVGMHTAIEVWYQPTPEIMTALNANVSTVGSQYFVQAMAGWRLFDAFYLGPELTTFSSYDYRQWRVGLHVTALHWLDLEWSGAVGLARDSEGVSGLYGRIGILRRH